MPAGLESEKPRRAASPQDRRRRRRFFEGSAAARTKGPSRTPSLYCCKFLQRPGASEDSESVPVWRKPISAGGGKSGRRNPRGRKGLTGSTRGWRGRPARDSRGRVAGSTAGGDDSEEYHQ